MNWNEILTQAFEAVIFPLLSIGTVYVIYLIKTKIQELKQKKDNELFNKYLTMLDTTIVDCVLATTQTYVQTLKDKGEFDLEAQKIAFTKTYENVMSILTQDAKEYLQTAIGDLETYVNNKIEAEVLANK